MQKKILVFDDDQDLLEICELILKSNGYQVETYSHCATLWDTIARFAPDLIIMDNRLPGVSGADTIREIKKLSHTKDIPTILFSGESSIEELADEAGADFYLPKPFDIVQLEKLVRKALTPATGSN